MEKSEENLGRIENKANDRYHCRINKDFKKALREEADKRDGSLNQFILKTMKREIGWEGPIL